MGRIMAGGMASVGPLLFGRRTYEDFYRVWPNRTDNPYTAVLDNAQKYVASTTLAEPLPVEELHVAHRRRDGRRGASSRSSRARTSW